MKEVEGKKVNIYAGLEWREQSREEKLLNLEKAANEKYARDIKLAEELAAKEKVKIASEKAAKDKAMEERRKRLESEKQQIKNEEETRANIKKQRNEAVKKFNSLPIDEMLLLLNDGDGESMENLYKNVINEAFDKYCNDKTFEQGLEQVPYTFNSKVSDEELKKAEDMFPLVFGELAQVEMPFLAYLLGNEGSDDPKECGDRIVENFVLDNQAVSDLVYRRMENVLSPEEYYVYEKIYVLNEISDTFKNAKKLKNKGKDKEAKEELDKLFSKLQYKCFYAEKVDDRIKVVVPAEDYNYDNYRVKEFLKNHPEKSDRKYNDDDLEYQLRFVKSIAAYPCSEQNVKREVFDGYDKSIPSGNDRKRYVLREIRAAFEVEAKYSVKNETELVTFNKDMAFLADYEQGDFRRMCRENPHIKHLLDMIADGPLVADSILGGKKQIDLYEEMKNDKDVSEAVSRYIRLTHSIVDLVRLSYKRQQYEREGWTAEKEKEFYDSYAKITSYLSYDIEAVQKVNLDKLNRYSNKSIDEYFTKGSVKDIEKTFSIIKGEMAALARGWNPSDTILYGIVYDVYRKSYAKYKDNSYDEDVRKMVDDCYEIMSALEKAESVVEKRDVFDKFEKFTLQYAEHKDVFVTLENNILTYDRTKDKFDKEYKDSLLKELKAGLADKDKLAEKMIKMQKIALKREETFHDDIFKKFADSLTKDDQIELQKALYKQRLIEMAKRGENAYVDQEEIFKRDELGDLKYDKNIYNNIFVQIGLIRAKNDGVAAVDKLFESFDNKLSEQEKQDIYQNHKKNVLDKDYVTEQYYSAADLMDKNIPDYGLKLVAAPEGGYNIKYSRPLIEIRKDVYQKLDAQMEDLEMQITKFKIKAQKLLDEPAKHTYPNNFKHFSDDSNIASNLKNIIKRDGGYSLASYMSDFEFLNQNIKKYFEYCEKDRAKNSLNEEEYKFYKEIADYAEEGAKVFSEERYPDLSRSNNIGKVRDDIEVVKSVWTSMDKKNKWKKVTLKEHEERQKAETNVDRYYKALNTPYNRSAKNLDNDYPGGLFFKPSMIVHIREKYVKAIKDLYDNKFDNVTKEFREFYDSLRELCLYVKVQDQISDDGQSLTSIRLKDAKKKLDAYLATQDDTEYADLNRYVANLLAKDVLTDEHIDGFDYYISNNNKIQKEMAAKKEAYEKKNNQAKLEEEKRLAEEKANQAKIEEEKRLAEEKANQAKIEEEKIPEEKVEQDNVKQDNVENVNNVEQVNGNAEKRNDIVLVKAFVKEVNSASKVLESIHENLISIQNRLKDAKKNANAQDYTKDGSDQYKAMAGALDKCINLLSENGNMSDIAKSLDELSKKSMQYYADRHGMTGIPAHKYGRKRLKISDDLSKSVPAMYFMVENALSSISKFGSTEEFVCKDKSFEDIINQSSDIANKYMLNEEERAAERLLEDAKNIADFQAKVLTDKVKGISKTMFNNYRNDKNIDDYLIIKRNMSFSDKVKYYTLCRQLKLITEVDISAFQAENYFKNFDGNYKKELDLKLKNPICKRILGSGKPTAFSDWDKYERNADNLSVIYLSELDSIINENVGLGNAVNNAAAGKQGDELIDAACTKCAQIITLQMLSKDKGRSLLYGMKLDSDYDNDVYKSLVKQTTEYFKAKRTFELKNGENLVTKADSVINNPKTISNVLSNIAANEKRKQLTDDNRINQVNKQPKQKGAKKK